MIYLPLKSDFCLQHSLTEEGKLTSRHQPPYLYDRLGKIFNLYISGLIDVHLNSNLLKTCILSTFNAVLTFTCIYIHPPIIACKLS